MIVTKSGGVSILFDTSYLTIENKVSDHIEASVYSETPGTSTAWGLFPNI